MKEIIFALVGLGIVAVVLLVCWSLGLKWSQEDIADKYFGLPDFEEVEVDGHQTDSEKRDDRLI
jgi:hypothetical protein